MDDFFYPFHPIAHLIELDANRFFAGQFGVTIACLVDKLLAQRFRGEPGILTSRAEGRKRL